MSVLNNLIELRRALQAIVDDLDTLQKKMLQTCDSVGDLQHYQDTTVGLWATDSINIDPEDIKKYHMFRLEKAINN